MTAGGSRAWGARASLAGRTAAGWVAGAKGHRCTSGARHVGRRRGARAGTGHARTQPRRFASRLVVIPPGEAAVSKADGNRIPLDRAQGRCCPRAGVRTRPGLAAASPRRGERLTLGRVRSQAGVRAAESPSAPRATAPPGRVRPIVVLELPSAPLSKGPFDPRRLPRPKRGCVQRGQRPPVPVVRETYVDCFRPAEKRLRWRPEADAGLSTWRRTAARRGEQGLSGRGRQRSLDRGARDSEGEKHPKPFSTSRPNRRRRRRQRLKAVSGVRIAGSPPLTGTPLPSGKTQPAAPRKRASSPPNLELIPTHKGVSHNVRDRFLLPRASKARSEQAHSTLVGTIRRKSGREGQHERGTKISQLSS